MDHLVGEHPVAGYLFGGHVLADAEQDRSASVRERSPLDRLVAGRDRRHHEEQSRHGEVTVVGVHGANGEIDPPVDRRVIERQRPLERRDFDRRTGAHERAGSQLPEDRVRRGLEVDRAPAVRVGRTGNGTYARGEPHVAARVHVEAVRGSRIEIGRAKDPSGGGGLDGPVHFHRRVHVAQRARCVPHAHAVPQVATRGARN